MGEPGGLPSMGSHRVRHDWSDLAAAYTHIYINNLKENKEIKKLENKEAGKKTPMVLSIRNNY